MIDWDKTYAAIYRSRKDYLKPIIDLDNIGLNDLLGMEEQKNVLYQNTLNFSIIKEQITHFYGVLRVRVNQA